VFWFLFSRCQRPKTYFVLNSTRYELFGSWVRDPTPVDKLELLNDGTRVYMTFNDIYTKMVHESGECRCYEGPVSAFDPSKWESYRSVPTGSYQIRKINE
jgi:hypothetical protein